METFLQLSPEERNLYCRQASERMEVPIPAAVIEKDFWVCWTLKVLHEIPELQGNITFKGGTSLSKAWGLIDRFSEDIDIAISRKLFGQEPPHGAEDAESNTQRKARLEELEEKSSSFVYEQLMPRLQEKISAYISPDEFALRPIQKGKETNIEFAYPGTLKNELGGLPPVVLIELVPRADEIPNEERSITPIIYEVLKQDLGEGSFNVSTLLPERTFLEKLLLIHETHAGFNKGTERKSRHYYDLLRLHSVGMLARIRDNPGLFKLVVEHRRTFFRYNTLDYDQILAKGVAIVPPEESIAEWRSDYERTKIMIHGKVPDFEEIIAFTQKLEEEFNAWVLEAGF